LSLQAFLFSICGSVAHKGPRTPRFDVYISHTIRHAPGRTPLNDSSAVAESATYTTHNKHNRHTSVPSVGFETVIPRVIDSSDLRLRPQGHRNRPITNLDELNCMNCEISDEKYQDRLINVDI